jgi:hypothetical protein
LINPHFVIGKCLSRKAVGNVPPQFQGGQAAPDPIGPETGYGLVTAKLGSYGAAGQVQAAKSVKSSNSSKSDPICDSLAELAESGSGAACSSFNPSSAITAR